MNFHAKVCGAFENPDKIKGVLNESLFIFDVEAACFYAEVFGKLGAFAHSWQEFSQHTRQRRRILQVLGF